MNFFHNLLKDGPLKTIKELDRQTRFLVLGVMLLFTAAAVIISQADLPVWLLTWSIVLLIGIGLVLTILGLRPEPDPDITELDGEDTTPPDDEAFSRFKDWGMIDLRKFRTSKKMGAFLSRRKRLVVLKTWFPEDDDIRGGLKIAMNGGASIQLILCDPRAPILGQRTESTNHKQVDAAIWIINGLDLVAKNVSEAKFEGVALYNHWPGCPVIWADDRLFMGFYFWGSTSPQRPWVEVKAGSDLAKDLEEQRDQLNRRAPTKLDTVDKLKKWLVQYAAGTLPPLRQEEPEA